MSSRARLRIGRQVHYYPTDVEATALGAGPWPARIVGVNADGTVDIKVDPPAQSTVGAAVATVAQADAPAQTGAYVQADVEAIRALANANKVGINAAIARLNQLVTVAGETRKASVSEGGAGGRFLVAGDPAHV